MPWQRNAEENLLYNGSFEILDGADGTAGRLVYRPVQPPGRAIPISPCLPGTPRKGEHSVQIENLGDNDARFAQRVEVEPESLYCLSGYIRAEQYSG